MITLVIPTLWMGGKINEIVSNFLKLAEEDIELILIDNTNSNFYTADKKIVLVKPSENLFVNPSWNIGVNLAKNDIVCIANDDIIFNLQTLINNIDLFKGKDFGMAGLDMKGQSKELNKDSDIITLTPTTYRGFGFGCFFIVQKNKWKNIPDKMKIFYGDDWLFHKCTINKYKTFFLSGLKWNGKFETTSKKFFNYYMYADHDHFSDER